MTASYGVARIRRRSFAYRVEQATDDEYGLIWLQDRATREQWECVVRDYDKFTRFGLMVPVETVLQCVVSCLAASSRLVPRTRTDLKLALRNVFGDKYLIVPVRVLIRGMRWSATYTFPLKKPTFRVSPPRFQQQPVGQLRSVCQVFDSDGDLDDEDLGEEDEDD